MIFFFDFMRNGSIQLEIKIVFSKVQIPFWSLEVMVGPIILVSALFEFDLETYRNFYSFWVSLFIDGYFLVVLRLENYLTHF